MLFFLVAGAFAQDIVQVPMGSTFQPPGALPFVVPGHSFLLPEAMYDKAITKAKQLDVCEPALSEAQASAIRWIDVANGALETCEAQFNRDEKAVEDLRFQVVQLDARAGAAEARVADLKGQRNTAWGIAGGLVLGAVAVTALAIAP